MKIPSKTWQKYIKTLAKINTRAAGDVVTYMVNHDVSTYEGTKALIDYAYAVSTKYGEAAAELSCQMYDAIATASKAAVPAAEPAATATYGEIAKTIYGTMASTKNPDAVGAAVGRSVKLASVDTLQQNALRDGAEWAWIPQGDTCPFCIMLASRGWVKASKKAIKNGHADHIHNNCDCTYCVRFDHETTVEGYGDGEKYYAIYHDQAGIDPSILKEVVKDGYDLNTPKGRMIAMSRAHRAANKDYINAQQREAHSRRQVRKTIEELENEADKWIKELSMQEKSSITKYAYNPGDKSPNRFFERINAMLRGEITEEDSLRRHVNNISSGLQKFRIEKDFYVYRRVDYDPTKDIKKGDLIVGEQFLSTSVDPEKTLKKEYLIKIRVRKGTTAAYIDSLSEFDQTELLIDKDVVFRVKSIQEKETLWEVVV